MTCAVDSPYYRTRIFLSTIRGSAEKTLYPGIHLVLSTTGFTLFSGAQLMNVRSSSSSPVTRVFASVAIFGMLFFAGCKSSSSPSPASNTATNGTAAPGGAASPSAQQGPGGNGAYSGANSGGYPGGSPQQSGQSAPQAPPPPRVADLPAGTRIRVGLDQDLGSKINEPGDTFTATVADNVVVNGQTVIPEGARAQGTVVDAKALGRFMGGARLEVRLDRVQSRWGGYRVSTSTVERVEKGKGKRTGLFVGGGAALGALVGGLAGGGKGALIGGLAGGGAGTAGSAFTGNQNIFLPTGTLLTFRLERSVAITE
ncbi:MAG: hypothetical protein ACP5E5_04835 [Acidobacteriaceae bacterium]